MEELPAVAPLDVEPTLAIIEDAHNRIRHHVNHTPVITCESIDRIIGASLFFKCENFQKVGAFKARGATNAVLSLSDEEAAKGVATHSSGNHAQALALAAKTRGIPVYIVMPKGSPAVKKAAVEGYGGIITECEPTLQARETTLESVVADTGATFIHPYNHYRIIAGAATAAKELIEEVGELDVIMAPVGGGGLLSGTALATHFMLPQALVIAGEPAGADDAARSLAAGEILPSVDPQTIADGLRTSLGPKTFAIIRRHVDRILTVSEADIIRAMRLVWERAKIIIEPSSAVPLAALLEIPSDLKGKRIGMILSGGNIDLDELPWMK